MVELAKPEFTSELEFRDPEFELKVRIKFDQYEHFPGRSRAPEGAERVWWIENGKMSMD